jgi:hypothetical protein
LARQGALPHAVDIATLAAYADCFRMMAVAALVVVPGIFLFRIAPRRAAEQRPA